MPEKSVVQKLLIKDNHRVLLLNEPDDYRNTVEELPSGVTILTEPEGPVDIVQIFITSKVELITQLKRLVSLLKPKGLLWITYPKGTARLKVDVNRDIIRENARTFALEAVSMIAIDDTWSALRLKDKS